MPAVAIRRAGGRVAVPIFILVLWEILYLRLGAPAMASPFQALHAVGVQWSEILGDLLTTLWTLAIAFGISVCVGAPLGFVLGLTSYWYRTWVPPIAILYAVPKIVLYPIFLLVFGLTAQGRIAFSVLHGLLPVVLLVASGTRTIPPMYHKVATAHRLSLHQRIRHVMLPAILPETAAALRISFGACFLGLIVAEMFASYEGVGFRLMKLSSLLQTADILAIIVLIVLIALIVTYTFLHWQERQEARLGRRGSLLA